MTTTKQGVRRVRFGMIGCGEVGQGVLTLLAAQAADLAERFGVAFEPVVVAVRNLDRDRGSHVQGIDFVTDPLLVVHDPRVELVVEVAGGLAMGPALEAALTARKPVVTANKALVAAQLGELIALSRSTGTPIGCEAAVAAALPILRSLGRRVDRVQRLLAIVNGTSNFVLTRMEQDELELPRAVAMAQKLGLAEADPTADIDGHDAAAKLSILAHRSLGIWAKPGSFPVMGIRDLLPADFDLADAMGHRIRHIAHAELLNDGVRLGVEPLLLPNWHLLAGVEEEYNAVYLCCKFAGDLSFFGKGAGGLPTATAVVGDMVDLALGTSSFWPAAVPAQLLDPALCDRRHYLRVTAHRHTGLARRIEGLLRKAGHTVQDRATCVGKKDSIHLGFLLAPCSDVRLAPVRELLLELGRVRAVLTLGITE